MNGFLLDRFMAIEHEILERLVALESDTKHILAKFDEVAHLSGDVVRLQETKDHHKQQIDILFDRSRTCDETSKNLNKWVNRGIGAYMVGVVFGGLISFFLMRMIEQYDSSSRLHSDLIANIDRRLSFVEYETRKKNESK